MADISAPHVIPWPHDFLDLWVLLSCNSKSLFKKKILTPIIDLLSHNSHL